MTEYLLSLKTKKQLAQFLGYKLRSLTYILYQTSANEKYSIFTIPKKNGGIRKITAPNEQLGLLQRRVADRFNELLSNLISANKKNSFSHGYRPGYSIITNAKQHTKKRYVLNLDLKDFFPSINFGRVRGLLISHKNLDLSPEVATMIAQIVCYNNELPQGSPSSPLFSNLVGHLLDVRLVKFARKTGCTYSRYVDDLSFSTNKKEFPSELAIMNDEGQWVLSKPLIKEIVSAGFNINFDKVSFQIHTSRQMTTGLIVNRGVNVPSEYYRKTRTLVHELIHNQGYFLCDNRMKGEKEPARIKNLNIISGRLSYIIHIKKARVKTKLHEYKSMKDGLHAMFPGLLRLYQKFLYYQHFHQNQKPLLICEGKTDIIYIKAALRQLHLKYPSLINFHDGSYEYFVSFFNYSENMKAVLDISEGTSGITTLIQRYEKKFMRELAHAPQQFPVYVVVDNDQGSNKVCNFFNLQNQSEIDTSKIYEKYLFKLMFSTSKYNTEIEDLFPKEILQLRIGEKSFQRKDSGSKNGYGKEIFARKIIWAKQNEIDFSGFEPFLNLLSDSIKSSVIGSQEKVS
jgi:RNA-directed DNA polymerase